MLGGIELPGDDPGREATVGGEHLVRTDHREVGADSHENGRGYSGDFPRQHQVVGQSESPPPIARVVPVHAEEIARVGRVRIHAGESRLDFGGDTLWLRQLGEARQADLLAAKARDGLFVDVRVDDVSFESELRADYNVNRLDLEFDPEFDFARPESVEDEDYQLSWRNELDYAIGLLSVRVTTDVVKFEEGHSWSVYMSVTRSF